VEWGELFVGELESVEALRRLGRAKQGKAEQGKIR